MKIKKTKYNSICFFNENHIFEEYKTSNFDTPTNECIEFIIDESGLYNQIHWWLTYKMLGDPVFFVRINKEIKLVKVLFHTFNFYDKNELMEIHELMFFENIEAISKIVPKLKNIKQLGKEEIRYESLLKEIKELFNIIKEGD